MQGFWVDSGSILGLLATIPLLTVLAETDVKRVIIKHGGRSDRAYGYFRWAQH